MPGAADGGLIPGSRCLSPVPPASAATVQPNSQPLLRVSSGAARNATKRLVRELAPETLVTRKNCGLRTRDRLLSPPRHWLSITARDSSPCALTSSLFLLPSSRFRSSLSSCGVFERISECKQEHCSGICLTRNSDDCASRPETRLLAAGSMAAIDKGLADTVNRTGDPAKWLYKGEQGDEEEEEGDGM